MPQMQLRVDSKGGEPEILPRVQDTAQPSKEVIPYGYCHCGCGEKTNIASRNDKRCGWIKGEPVNYLKGHFTRIMVKDDNHPAKNIIKKTHCKRGHERVPENLSSGGKCKLCATEYEKQRIRKPNPNYVRKNKEERNRKTREWHAKNKDRVKKTQKLWYENNKDHCKEYRAQYYINNSDKIKLEAEKWALSHPDERKRIRLKHYATHPYNIYNKEYYAKNKTWRKLKSAEWARNNKDLVSIRNKKYRQLMPNWYLAAMANLPVGKCTEELLEIKKLTLTLRRRLKNDDQK